MQLSSDRIGAIRRRYCPRGWRVSQSRHRAQPASLSGLCDFHKRTLFVPMLRNVEAVYVFLHECGHARLHNKNSNVLLARHIEEYEAEIFAISVLRLEGIPVPRALVARAKRDVRDWIARDTKHGAAILPYVRKWAMLPNRRD